MEEMRSSATARETSLQNILGILALCSVITAVLGIYTAVLSWIRSEKGSLAIRHALGATPVDLTRLLLVKSTLTLGIGLAAGFGGFLLYRELILAYVLRAPLEIEHIVGPVVITFLAFSTAFLLALRVLYRMNLTATLREMRT
jgi:ABC-type antimicrobial peptide transport system permease subunit